MDLTTCFIQQVNKDNFNKKLETTFYSFLIFTIFFKSIYEFFQTLYQNSKIRQLSANGGTVSPRNAVSPIPGAAAGPLPQQVSEAV